jgi:hypothetical protein
MSKQIELVDSDRTLVEIITKELLICGCDDNAFTVTVSDLLYDDESGRSLLVDILHAEIPSDGGLLKPDTVTLQFDYDKVDGVHALIVGEDTPWSITYGNLFAMMYFSSLKPVPADHPSSTPAAKWRVDGQPDPHGRQYDCERAALTLGHLTDDEMANEVFLRPTIMNVTAAKERIRWLSRKLVEAIGDSKNA